MVKKATHASRIVCSISASKSGSRFVAKSRGYCTGSIDCGRSGHRSVRARRRRTLSNVHSGDHRPLACSRTSIHARPKSYADLIPRSPPAGSGRGGAEESASGGGEGCLGALAFGAGSGTFGDGMPSVDLCLASLACRASFAAPKPDFSVGSLRVATSRMSVGSDSARTDALLVDATGVGDASFASARARTAFAFAFFSRAAALLSSSSRCASFSSVVMEVLLDSSFCAS